GRKYVLGPEAGTTAIPAPTHADSILNRISRCIALVVLMLGAFAAPPTVAGQSPSRVPRIGYLVLSPLADPPSAERAAFLDGLRELGYVVGQNIVIDSRSAGGNRGLLPSLRAGLGVR